MKYVARFFVLVLTIALLGCSEHEVEGVAQRAVAIESSDECHLCGMLITRFPGPKGELIQQGNQQVKKFCSTRDLFAYALDPEHRASVQGIWVHDMAKVPWEYPDDEHFVNARDAWYVINSSKLGAMGPSLASFMDEADAKSFVESNGGEIIGFDKLSMDVLNQMTSSSMPIMPAMPEMSHKQPKS